MDSFKIPQNLPIGKVSHGKSDPDPGDGDGQLDVVKLEETAPGPEVTPMPGAFAQEDGSLSNPSEDSELMQPPSMKLPSPAPPAHLKSSDPSRSPKPQKPQESPAEKQAKYAEIIASLKYTSPEHGAQYADPRYGFEVLKTGTIVDRVKFRKMDNKGFYVVGRVPACDVVAENPTVSRTHAILQFVQGPPEANKKTKDKDKTSNARGEDKNGTDVPTHTGLYVYDLNSTHGTFINKNQVYPNRYYRLHVGHVLKFGNSTRLYVLLGPEEDEEEESEKSVTELQNEKLQKELERKRLEAEGILIKTTGDEDEDGCTWGMGEDAEEESDMRENPFAINFEESESFDNPKRTLRGWFEREGYDLVYDCREKAPGQFICRINLPIDGPAGQPVFAEVDHKGKKKEAVHQAALQACQILDKYGVLRQSHVESKSTQKKKNWQDQDYYSSDEDTFLDRTGSVEQKRQKRMKSDGKVEEKVETYESLCSKADDLQREIDSLKSQIDTAQTMNAGDEDVDIDDYVNSLKAGITDVKKLKAKLREATEELKRVRKLADIAKPAILPVSLTPTAPTPPAPAPVEKKPNYSIKEEEAKARTPQAQINISIGTKKDKTSDSEEETSRLSTEVEKSETEDQTMASPSPSVKKQNLLGPRMPVKPIDIDIPTQPQPPAASKPNPTTKFPTGSDEEDDADGEDTKAKNSSSSDDDNSESLKEPASKKKKRNRQRQKVSKEPKYDYDDNDPKYSTWVPPSDQRGDGKTALNEKLGY